MDEPPASAGDNVRAVKGKSKPEVKSRYASKESVDGEVEKGGLRRLLAQRLM